jgi:hypothetical protein
MSRGYSVGAAVYGTKASLEMDRVNFRGGDLDLTMFMTKAEDLGPKKAPKTRVSAVSYSYDPVLKGRDDPKINKPYYALFGMYDLVKAIQDDRQPDINVYEAARSSAAAICAELSIRERRTIQIPSFYQRLN